MEREIINWTKLKSTLCNLQLLVSFALQWLSIVNKLIYMKWPSSQDVVEEKKYVSVLK